MEYLPLITMYKSAVFTWYLLSLFLRLLKLKISNLGIHFILIYIHKSFFKIKMMTKGQG